MTNDKAREYFSAHHEGVLEPGLAASLERRLRDDAGLRAEYAAFAETVDSLDALRAEAIEIPSFLSARLADRLEPVLDARRPSFWESLLSPLRSAPRMGFALGLAGALVVASVGLRSLDVRGTGQASILPGSGESAGWTWSEDRAAIEFPGLGRAHQAVVTPESGEAQTFTLAAGQPLSLTLGNPNPQARRFAIDFGEGPAQLVVVPGTRVAGRHEGSGTIRDLAAALADAYHMPVVVHGLDTDAPVHWRFAGAEAQAAAERALGDKGHATLMRTDVLQLGP